MTDKEFDDLRPYRNDEINAAMQRIIANPLIDEISKFLFPTTSTSEVKKMLSQINTIDDFQIKVMHYAINYIAKKTMTSFTYSGIDKLDKSKQYLFVSNHRDIVLDSALLQLALHDSGHNTSEITFGSNLMQNPFVVDIGKSNKMFKVERGGTPREFYKNSMILSEYIRHTLLNRKESIWIAQRNGRSKDGNDFTDHGIVKMFGMSSKKPIAENLAELNITPMSVSYQWEVCDLQKVNELYISREEKYIKKSGEDLQSILQGFLQFKGKVHIEVSKPISLEEITHISHQEKNEVYTSVAALINERIHNSYKLWSTNFIAHDLLSNSDNYANNEYSADEKDFFVSEMNKKLATLSGDYGELKDVFLGIYANPINNARK